MENKNKHRKFENDYVCIQKKLFHPKSFFKMVIQVVYIHFKYNSLLKLILYLVVVETLNIELVQ